MSADFDEEGLKNIIYILGSEKGLGSVDKFFFLILLEMAFVLSILFECLSLISITFWFSCHRKKTWKVSSKTLFKSFWCSIYQLRLINFLGSG